MAATKQKEASEATTERVIRFKEVDSLPPVVRRGNRKVSAENQELDELIQTGKTIELEDTFEDTDEGKKARIAMNQKIRSRAKALGFNVAIRNLETTIRF